MIESTTTCDGCGKTIKPGNSTATWYLEMYAMLAGPDIRAGAFMDPANIEISTPHHFCNKACVAKWATK